MTDNNKEQDEYRQQQTKWVKATGLVAGDTVTVMGATETGHAGWPDQWTARMHECVGKELTVVVPDDITGVFCRQGTSHQYVFPFYVLAKTN